MSLANFQELLVMLSDTFKYIFNKIDHVYLFGSFSFLDFIIACFVIDIVITAFFVTFNVGTSSEMRYKESNIRRKNE